MLELRVGTGLDDGLGWRHLLAPGQARAGWECVGPSGLVRRLGVLLGVHTQDAARGLRIQHLDAQLAAKDDGKRHYSASRRADPAGVAAHLLALTDELRFGGWDGRALDGSVRLEELSALQLADAPAGAAEGAAAVLRALQRTAKLPVQLKVTLDCPRAHFPPLHRRVLERLAQLGAEIVEPAPREVTAAAGSDLARLQAALLAANAGADSAGALSGDGSVWVLEAETPWEAAELLGVFMADHPEARRSVIVPREGALLDAVLRRRGLPALGIQTRSRWRPALQVLPLRLSLLFYPRDPNRALELLSLPVAPLRAWVRRRLVQALQKMPGVDGPEWRRAVEEVSKRAAEDAHAEALLDGSTPEQAEASAKGAARELKENIQTWFGGGGHSADEGTPIADAVAICRDVSRWARARATLGEADDAAFHEAASVARSLETMLEQLPPAQRLPRLQLEQLHDLALGGGAAGVSVTGESGRPTVGTSVESVVPCDEVVWWSFDEEGAAAGAPGAANAWTLVEVEALAAQGVTLAAPGERRAQEQDGWHRAVFHAQRRLVLVRIRSSGGEPVQSHPFEDELRSRLPKGSLAACTVTAEDAASGAPVRLGTGWSPRSDVVPPAPDLQPQAVWTLPPEHLAPNAKLSPTSVETFLGCPLKWALTHVAGLRSGALGGLPEGSKLVGDFAHRLLQDLFFVDDAPDFDAVTPEEAVRWTQQAFDARVEGEAAPLLRPGYEQDLRHAREAISRAAGDLVALLQGAGWRPTAPEETVTTTFNGLELEGRVDLLLERDGRPGVLDLKLGKTANRRKELRAGRALQLALYAQALATGAKSWPPSAYMTVEDGRVLTTTTDFADTAEVVQGPSLRETVKRAEQMWTWWRGVVDEGLVPARHEELEEAAHAVANEVAGPPPEENAFAEASPPCGYCDFQNLCTTRVVRDVRDVREVQP